MHCNTINNSHGVGLGTTISRHVPVFFFTPHTAKHNQNRGLVQLKQRILTFYKNLPAPCSQDVLMFVLHIVHRGKHTAVCT